jgi:hypothetical protein
MIHRLPSRLPLIERLGICPGVDSTVTPSTVAPSNVSIIVNRITPKVGVAVARDEAIAGCSKGPQ